MSTNMFSTFISPAVTIVITCYNYGHYLEGCLESVFSQTYQSFEIIVVDDGSTDNTTAIMSKYKNIKNINYIRQKNGGQANAKNRGIKESSGEFIAFLDADDLWREDKLEKQIPLFQDSSVGVVFSRSLFIDENGQKLEHQQLGKYLQPRSGWVSNDLYVDNFVPFSSSIIRRECLAVFSGFDESLEMGIDWDLWLRISTKYQFDFIDEPLLKYRVGHPGQMSKKQETRQKCSERIMANFLDRYPSILSKRTIIDANHYTLCNRASFNMKTNKSKAYYFYLKALWLKPFDFRAYKGIIKCLIA